ncbi:MAG: PAS domain-containing protein [Candidatus Bathyarchaeota archaeon]|nr:PAS domain-containing protein [Candidatus Bathyarchaeota archaeon]
MVEETHHIDSEQLLISGLYSRMRRIIDSSTQPVFIYLNDDHKVCNQRFAELLGYKTPQDWSGNPGFLEEFVDDEASRNAFMSGYWGAINNMSASTVQVTWRRKDEKKVESTLVILPMEYEGHILLAGFVIGS